MDIQEEQAMDTAISEALGETPAAYQAGGEGESRRAGREMRETVARLAAASPHMKPSPELRARILEASAPKTYKLEDYRKVGSEDFRWYKWGFYAAAAFLITAAMYNINVVNNTNARLDAAQKQYAALAKEANALEASNERGRAVVSALVDPRGTQITWNDATTHQPVMRAVVDGTTAVMIMPQELLPNGAQPQLTLKGDNGQAITFQTTVISAPAAQLGIKLPTNYQDIARDFAKQLNAPQQLKPGQPGKPIEATNAALHP